MSERARAFDHAFQPHTEIVRMNLLFASGDMEIGGKIGSVSPGRCDFCGTFEGDCWHKERMAAAVAAVADEIALDAQDQYETYHDALDVGIQ